MRSNPYKDIAQHVANKTRDKENWRQQQLFCLFVQHKSLKLSTDKHSDFGVV